MDAKNRMLTVLYGVAIVTTAAALTLGATEAIFAMMD
jgi:hypothetical protein